MVALGEGLETQFWRLDNGRMRWLSVDLPAALDLRVLPEGPRQRSYAGSALDLGWLDQLDPAAPVLVTAQGLLVYFQRNEVYELIAAIAERLPGWFFVFDVVPDKMLELARRMPGVSVTRRSSCGRGCSTLRSARRSARSLVSRGFATSCRRAHLGWCL